MKDEIEAAVSFFLNHRHDDCSSSFKLDKLSSILHSRYTKHWHVQDPERGSAYRALNAQDPALPAPSDLDLGCRWTMWIDPGCVSFKSSEERDVKVQEIWGALHVNLRPTLTPSRESSESSSASSDDVLPTLCSPVKRSRAIQIIHPDARKPSMGSSLVLPLLEVAPPTPVPASLSNPFSAPDSPCQTRSASPVERPHSRTSSVSSEHSSLFSGQSAPSSASSVATTTGHQRKVSSSGQSLKLSHSRSNSTNSVASNTSSGSHITRPSSACSVTEYSNGKVAVLGGGVLLGLPAGAAVSSSDDSSEGDEEPSEITPASYNSQDRRRRGNGVRTHRRKHHGGSTSSNASSNAGHSISRLHAHHSQALMLQWNEQQQWANHYLNQNAQHQQRSGTPMTTVF